MSKMIDFFGPGATSKVERAAALSKGKSKAERRRIEQALLKPEPIAEYTGEPSTLASDVEARSVKVVFKTQEDFVLFSKFFKVYQRVEQSVHDTELLLVFLHLLNKGALTYEKGKGIAYAEKSGRLRWLG